MPAQPRRYSRAFFIALAANAFFFLGFQAGFPVLPRYIADVVVGRSPEQAASAVGLATTVVALVAVSARIPTGQMADRLGRRRFMFAGSLLFTLAPLIYSVSRGMPVLLIGRVVQGLGLAMFTTAYQALITDLAPAERRGEALGLSGASTSMAFIVGPLVGDWLADGLGYAVFFRISAATTAVSVGLVMLMASTRITVSADAGAAPVASAGLRGALAQRGVRAAVLTMAALGIPFGAFITFLPLFAEEQHISGVGIVFSVYALTALVTQPVSGWLSDRLGRRAVILSGLAVTSMATFLLALDSSLLVFAVTGVVFGLGGGLVRGGVDALTQDSVPPTLRGTAAAVQYTSFDFWIGLGSYPLGLMANAAGYAATYALTGLACLLGNGGLALILRETSAARPMEQRLNR